MDDVKFTDLFTGKPRAEQDMAEERFAICKTCEHFSQTTKRCKKCGCIMKLKTKLEEATCPIGKW
jgi:predicted metal-binding protein